MVLSTAFFLALCVAGDSAPTMVKPGGGHARMVSALREVRKQCEDNNPYLGWGPVHEVRKQLGALPQGSPPIGRIRLQVRLGTELLRMGETIDAIQTFVAATEGYEEGLRSQSQLTIEQRNEVGEAWLQLGTAYLRLAEDQNCCLKNNRDSCIFPIRGGGIHQDKEGSTQALRALSKALALVRPNSQVGRKARWLSNVAAMTLGGYPDGLPESLRIDPKAIASDEPFPSFVDVGSEVGLTTPGLAGGMVVEDFDGDGLYDVMTSDSGATGQLRLYLSSGEGTLEDKTKEAGLLGLLGGLNLVSADYDGDGDVDIYVLRGAWLRQQGRHPNSLLRNEGGGRFVDMTFEAGLGQKHWPTQTAAFADYDLDGDLDLYVGNESEPEQPAPCQLFRNNGNGTFTDVAKQAGVLNNAYTKGVSWGDIDNDGDPDLYVSNMAAPNRLYRNAGDGTFADVAVAQGVTTPVSGFPCWFFDYDNDGALDIFAASYGGPGRPPTLADIAGSYMGLRHRGESFRLYRGDGEGGFVDVAKAAGLNRPWLAMGSNFGDADNDGFQDIYLGTGYPFYEGLMPNVMLRNRSGEGFADVTTEARMGHLQKGHGVAFADMDGDGDQDVAVRMGGAYPGDAYRCVLFRNPGNANRWLKIQLQSPSANHFGVGARIRVDIVEGARKRSIYRTVSTGGSFGCNPMRQELGLGKADRIERVEVVWPASGLRQSFRDVEPDTSILIREGQDRPEVLVVRTSPLGTGDL